MLVSREEQEMASAKRVGIATTLRGADLRRPAAPSLPSARLPPKMTLKEFKRRSISIIEEYFESRDAEDVSISLNEMSCPAFHYAFVKRALTAAMDRNDRAREATSRLISKLYPRVLSTHQIQKGFERMFEQMDDLSMDVPGASEMATKFLCRAVADEVIPPSFLQDPFVCSIGESVVEHAKILLSQSHSFSRLERVWGPGDGRRVPRLKSAIKDAIAEYLLSRDVEEATLCVRRLDTPHFHHEVIKRAVVMSMDGKSEDRASVSDLFAHLRRADVVSPRQFLIGFQRLVECLDDLKFDVPSAETLLNEFVSRAVEDGVLAKDFRSPPASRVVKNSPLISSAARSCARRKAE